MKNLKKIDEARVGWEILVAVIGILVAIAIGVSSYNYRYDSSANSAGAFKASYSNNANVGNATITASAGSVWYGCFQVSGKSDTSYDFYYKNTSSANYGSCVNTVTFNNNGVSNKKGDWRLARSYNTQKYDIKVKRTSNKSSSSALEVDWAVDSYNSTGN